MARPSPASGADRRRALPPGFGVVYIEEDAHLWEFHRAGVLVAMSAHVPVLMVHPMRVTTGYSHAVRMASRLRHPQAVEQLGPGRFQLRVPGVFPGGRRGSVRALNQRLLARYIRRAMPAAGISTGVMWFNFPWWHNLPGQIKGLLSVYDCLDRRDAYPGVGVEGAANLRRWETAIMTTPGLAFAHSVPLVGHLEELGDARPVRHLGGSVTPLPEVPAPPAIDGLPRPLAGVIGTIGYRLDFTLLEAVAERLSGGTLVLAGRVDGESPEAVAGLQRLRRRPNVHLTGELSRAQLAAVARKLDVGLLPLADNAMNRYCEPDRLYQYLAAGRPVMANSVVDTTRLARWVRTADTPGAFAAGAAELAAMGPLTGTDDWLAHNTDAARAVEALALIEDHLGG